MNHRKEFRSISCLEKSVGPFKGARELPHMETVRAPEGDGIVHYSPKSPGALGLARASGVSKPVG
ncbi:MAG: hypothetical protein JW986_11240 [Methanotrichaceae archaeon]|nr:hypothetical protein [Methanotrichaceae archaeon]